MPSGIYKRKRKPIIRKGDRFNKLVAIEFVEMRKSKQFWLFKCDCGRKKVISVNDVKGKIKSIKACGCLRYRHKHKMCNTKIYNIWCAMKARCLNKNHKHYKNYGGRGITVCKEWLKFENFYKDMGNKIENKSLDRIDNNGNYYKENCRWATPEEQSNNTRHNRLITYKGKTQTIAQWAKRLDIERNVIYKRLRYGWTIDKIFTVPVQVRKKNKKMVIR